MTHVQLLTKLAEYDDRRRVVRVHEGPDSAPEPSRRAPRRPTKLVAALMRTSAA